MNNMDKTHTQPISNFGIKDCTHAMVSKYIGKNLDLLTEREFQMYQSMIWKIEIGFIHYMLNELFVRTGTYTGSKEERSNVISMSDLRNFCFISGRNSKPSVWMSAVREQIFSHMIENPDIPLPYYSLSDMSGMSSMFGHFAKIIQI